MDLDVTSGTELVRLEEGNDAGFTNCTERRGRAPSVTQVGTQNMAVSFVSVTTASSDRFFCPIASSRLPPREADDNGTTTKKKGRDVV